MAVGAFVIFYVAVPAFLHGIAGSELGQTGYLKPMTDMMIFRRIHWAERFGLVLTIACLIIAAWKALTDRSVGHGAQWFIRVVARLLGREIE